MDATISPGDSNTDPCLSGCSIGTLYGKLEGQHHGYYSLVALRNLPSVCLSPTSLFHRRAGITGDTSAMFTQYSGASSGTQEAAEG